MNLEITEKQDIFINADADEVLYGGAAGGGKSYGQLIDAFLKAIQYPGIKQLILRRTYPELERSLIRGMRELYPQEVYIYNDSKHLCMFKNGSLIDFAFCQRENDVYIYQSAEYDIIRIDELTHFTSFMYFYLRGRIRGTNDFPKQMKSTTNPGNIGHAWVKERFIDAMPPNQIYRDDTGTRYFIPAKIPDNVFLTKKDPGYVKRLQTLPENERKALIDGLWDLFEGQYFSEFKRDTHVIKPFEIPKDWKRYFVLDYGLDMLAGYWIAVDFFGKAYVYKEIYQSGLIISEACKAIKDMTDELIELWIAPPDLWNKRQDTGKSAAEIFGENGIDLYKTSNDRVQGWLNLKEWLKVKEDEQGKQTPQLVIFENCTNLIACLPALQYDSKNPNDAKTEPHEITHAPDAIRYFVAARPMPAYVEPDKDEDYMDYDDQVNVFIEYGR